MFEKILIANRGEIAVRIIRACKELNIRTVAVYSKVDMDSMHVQMADEAVCIGPGPSNDSYLRIDRIICAAEIADVDAIHPGYGFLSENPHFADICENCNIRFIGPSSRAMNALADKAASRTLAKKAGVQTSPGSEGVVENEQDALAVAKRIGYPVMIKAIAGGGGRGMRAAHNDGALVKGYHTARSEAEKAFGQSGVYIEKFIENSHHIEFQIFGDSKGNYIHLGERDCSIQRRNQKLVEETPSPLLETPLHWIVHGFDEDLNVAMRNASLDMMTLLTDRQRLSRDDAYSLMSVAADFAVTQVVDGQQGIHCRIRRGMFHCD